jgi:tetratricopeptide (TPR) repeat protein
MASAEERAERDEYLLRLGEHFYDAHQYYRAIGVFEELALFTSDEALARQAHLRIAMAYHHGLQIDEAVRAYDQLLARDSSDRDTAGYVRILRVLVRAEGHWRDLRFVPVTDLLAELEPLAEHAGARYQPTALYHLARLRLAHGDRAAAVTAYQRGVENCRAHHLDDCDAFKRLDKPLAADGPRQRSPALGLALNAVIPGLGSLYSGHSFDGVYYFGLTVGSGLMAWDIYESGHSAGDQAVSFYVLAALATTFYSASVTQGWLGVERWNEVHARERRRKILGTTELPLPLDP